MNRSPHYTKAANKTIKIMSSMMLLAFGMHCILRGIALPEIKLDFDLSYTETSVIVSISSVGYLLMAIFSAKLGEKNGQKNMLSLFTAGISVTALLITVAKAYIHLLTLFLLAGCSYGGTECLVIAILKRHYLENSDRAANSVFSFYSLGSLIVSVTGGWLMWKGFGWRPAYRIVSAAAGIVFLYSLTVHDNSTVSVPRVNFSEIKSLFRDKIFVGMCFATALLSGAENASISWMNTFLSDTVYNINIFVSSCLTALFFVFLYSGRLIIARFMKRFESITITIVCCFLTGITVFLVSYVKSPSLMLVGIAMFGLSVSSLYPLFVSITNGLSSAGIIYSFTFTTISIMNFTVNYLMGAIADKFDLPCTFQFCAAIYVLTGVLAFLCRKSVLRRSREDGK